MTHLGTPMSEQKVEYDVLAIDYRDLPWFRKRRYLFVLLILFVPATLIIASTGKIYGQVAGETVEFHPSFNKRIMFISALLFGLAIFRLIAAI